MRVRAAVLFAVVSMVCILLAESVRYAEQSRGVTFPVLSDMILDAGNPEIILQNPTENKGKYVIKYEFVNTMTGGVLFSTNWLEGGRQYHYMLNDLKGTVYCKVHVYAKDADTYKDVSSVDIFIKIGVKSYET